MKINLWLRVPKAIGNVFSGGRYPQAENCGSMRIAPPAP